MFNEKCPTHAYELALTALVSYVSNDSCLRWGSFDALANGVDYSVGHRVDSPLEAYGEGGCMGVSVTYAYGRAVHSHFVNQGMKPWRRR